MTARYTRREFVSAANVGLLAVGFGGSGLVSASAADTGSHTVKMIENVWIPMSDGVRLAARMWIPENADQHPVPALFEYYPYRKRDHFRTWDETRHPFFSSHGYACIRVDIRGSGDSEGLLDDEYVLKEQDDGVEVIAWLARQPWCTGKVGMFGISWGGFNSLQVAARRPSALKAVMAYCATDDRYADECHYIGGAISDCMFYWGADLFAQQGLPPDPEIVGDRWREMWHERLKHIDFDVINWMKHQQRDDFWKHGSIREDYSSIQCAVYGVGGWADPYARTIPRMLEGLSCPRKGLIGPWGHNFPNEADPGPAIDSLNEALRWWDYWLKDIDTGIMDEPMYRVWMQDEASCCGTNNTPGRWVAEDNWPSPRIQADTYYLTDSGLSSEQEQGRAVVLSPKQTVGSAGGPWFMTTTATELPLEQGVDDARSLVFDGEPLAEDFEILGQPTVELDLSVDQTVAMISVRLNEVAPGGESKRVSYAILNLTQRDSNENPRELEPNKRFRVTVTLRDIAHKFKVGHRIRVSISTSYWPQVWPSPKPVTLTLFTGTSSLCLPVRPPRNAEKALRPFGKSFVPKTSKQSVLLDSGPAYRRFEYDVASGKQTVRRGSPLSKSLVEDIGTVLSNEYSEVSEITDDDPNTAKVEHWRMYGLQRDEWDIRVKVHLCITSTVDQFHVSGDLQAFEKDEEVFSNTWTAHIPRRLL